MSPIIAWRRVRLGVGQRLFLGLLPSLLAVALVASLAYYGQYARAAPEAIVLAAAVLALASLAGTWVNARHLAARIARLAARPAGNATPDPAALDDDGVDRDEIDHIERVVDRLGGALAASEVERTRAVAAADERLQEQSVALAATAREAIARLDNVRLPLHILLENRFGDVNENQEELLRDARDAAERMDGSLRHLATIADADRGALGARSELVQVNDVVRGVLPLARAAAERRGAQLVAELEPGLPRVRCDGARLADALTLLLDAAASASGPERPVVVSTQRGSAPGTTSSAASATITIAPRAAAAGQEVATILAGRLVDAQGGRLESGPDAVTVHLGLAQAASGAYLIGAAGRPRSSAPAPPPWPPDR